LSRHIQVNPDRAGDERCRRKCAVPLHASEPHRPVAGYHPKSQTQLSTPILVSEKGMYLPSSCRCHCERPVRREWSRLATGFLCRSGWKQLAERVAEEMAGEVEGICRTVLEQSRPDRGRS